MTENTVSRYITNIQILIIQAARRTCAYTEKQKEALGRWRSKEIMEQIRLKKQNGDYTQQERSEKQYMENKQRSQKLFHNVQGMRTGEKNQQGNILSTVDELINRWKEYFKVLLSQQSILAEKDDDISLITADKTFQQRNADITVEEV